MESQSLKSVGEINRESDRWYRRSKTTVIRAIPLRLRHPMCRRSKSFGGMVRHLIGQRNIRRPIRAFGSYRT